MSCRRVCTRSLTDALAHWTNLLNKAKKESITSTLEKDLSGEQKYDERSYKIY